MNLVLYRKYRPQTFAEITGQEHIVRTLTGALTSGKTSHAYLFAGPRGTGKTTIARILAKAVNCEKREETSSAVEPCNRCQSCLDITEGRALDLIEIDAASNRGIDEIRELREGIKFTPLKSKYKVFLIDECHSLTKDAFNALLKILEEPPAHAMFILATTEIHKVIPTILSRVQRFDFRKLRIPEITGRLAFICKKEGIEAEEEVLKMIASNADGCLRDSESMLGQVISFSENNKILLKDVQDILGVIGVEKVTNFINLLIAKKNKEAILFVNEINDEGGDLAQFDNSCINYLRKMLLLRIDETLTDFVIPDFTAEQAAVVKEQASHFSPGEISRLLNIFLQAADGIKRYPLAQMALEMAIVEIGEMSKPEIVAAKS